ARRECRVYVGNLAYRVRLDELREFMEQAGEVVYVEIMTMAGGRSKGCGVVEYRTPEDAERAIRKLHDVPLLGRAAFVREDREMDDPRAPENESAESRELFLSNASRMLPLGIGWQQIKDLFKKIGMHATLPHADLNVDEAGRPIGTAVAVMGSAQDAREVIRVYNGSEWHGRRLESGYGSNGGYSAIPPPPPPPVTHNASGGSYQGYASAPSGASYGAAPSMAPTAYGAPSLGGANPMNVAPGPGIFVRNLPYSTTNEDLIELFRTCGNIMHAEILLANGKSRGCGVVRFDQVESAERAISKLTGYVYGGRALDLRYDRFN
ncbi:hypothetical protein THASP1DRAFT_13992, partial [Thamnocephalis sphaerospora]